MNRLPLEIQNQIFILIDQQDKVECLTVCWEWNQIIEKLSLFEIVHIGSQNQFKKLLEKIEEEPDFSERMTSLIFDMSFNGRVTTDDILEYFPSLRELSALKSGYTYGRYFENYRPKNHPQYQLQYINTTCSVLECMRLLPWGICPNLTNLSILAQDDEDFRDWIELLENAPALTSLSMYGCMFDLLDLENLHTVLPLLTSLTLTSNSVQWEFPPLSDIQPATSMTSLYITPSMYDAGDQRKFFEYVAIKYPCLTEFGCNSMVMNLEDLRMESVFEDGFSSILDSIGSRLTTLTLDLDAVDPIWINYLESSNCQIENFRLCGSNVYQLVEALAMSDRAKYVQKLESKAYSVSRPINLKLMAQFIQLKTLCLENSPTISKTPINFSELFHFLGDRLETLKLIRFNIAFDDHPHQTETKSHHHHHQQQQEYKLTSLTFDQVDASSQLYRFVNQFLVHLRHLKFAHCNLASIYCLSLPNINLSGLEIIEPFPENKKLLVKTLNKKLFVKILNEKLLVETLNNKQQRWYTSKSISGEEFAPWDKFNINYHSVLPSVRSFPFDKFMEEPMITVECNSLVHVSLVNVGK